MINQEKLIDLELALLRMWAHVGIKEIYKYKNRIKIYKREGLGRFELFYDLSHAMFTDVEDTANGDDLFAEDCKASIEMLIKRRERSRTPPLPTIKPGDRELQKDMEWAQIISDAGEYKAWTEPLIYWLQQYEALEKEHAYAKQQAIMWNDKAVAEKERANKLLEEIARINSEYYADRQRFYDRGRQLARFQASLDWLKQRFEEEWNFELGIGEVVEEIIYRFEGGGESDARQREK